MNEKLNTYTMPYDDGRVQVEVCFVGAGESPFITGACGRLTIENIADIEDDFVEPDAGIFTHGDGLYLFDCRWFPGQYGEHGQCELPCGWELNIAGFRPFPSDGKTEPES